MNGGNNVIYTSIENYVSIQTPLSDEEEVIVAQTSVPCALGAIQDAVMYFICFYTSFALSTVSLIEFGCIGRREFVLEKRRAFIFHCISKLITATLSSFALSTVTVNGTFSRKSSTQFYVYSLKDNIAFYIN